MKKLILTLSMLLALSTNASTVPTNDLYIPVTHNKSAESGVGGEAQFNQIIDSVESIYSPMFKEIYGAELKVFRKWEDGTVNAYAQQAGKVWQVHMFGGLARHQAITADGFRAVICHEIGHHIGGAPKIVRWGMTQWASNEGQADYFATSKCLRKYFEKDKEFTIKVYERATSKEEKYAKTVCDKVNSSELDAAICFRSAMAGQSLANLFRDLRSLPKAPSFMTPDTKVVSKTDHAHPEPQCRMDTYFQGAICDKDHNILPDQSDAAVGYCNRKDGYELGIRPKCWMNPSEHGL